HPQRGGGHGRPQLPRTLAPLHLSFPMSTRGRSPRLAVIAVAAIAAGAGVFGYLAHGLDDLENNTIDTRFPLRGAERPDHLLVVAIDDKTFSQLRLKWPFPRSLHGKAIDQLTKDGASQIVYDVQFTEPTTERQDLALYDSVARSRRVVLATTATD